MALSPLACPGESTIRLVHDPEGVEVEFVPPGHDGVIDIEIINATADIVGARRFWVEAWLRLVEMGLVGEMAPVSLGDTARGSFICDPDGGYREVSERAEFTGRPLPF